MIEASLFVLFKHTLKQNVIAACQFSKAEEKILFGSGNPTLPSFLVEIYFF